MSNIDNLTPWGAGVCGNPKGRPKKKVLPEDVRQILATHSPALMQLACDVALGRNGQTQNNRMLQTLVSKLAPDLKSIEIKDNNSLPTMIIMGAGTPQHVIDSVRATVSDDTSPPMQLPSVDSPPPEK